MISREDTRQTRRTGLARTSSKRYGQNPTYNNEGGNNIYFQVPTPSVWKRGAFWNSEEEVASREKCRVREQLLCT